MEIELRKIIKAQEAINTLISQNALSLKFQNRLSYLIREIENFFKKRDGLIKKYTDREDKISKEEIKDTNEQIEDFLNELIEVKFTPIKLEELFSRKDENGEPLVRINGKEMIAMEPFIEGTFDIFEK